MALAAIAEGGLVVVAGEAFSLAAVVGDGNHPLFLRLKKLFARRWQAHVAIQTGVALGGVQAMIEDD